MDRGGGQGRRRRTVLEGRCAHLRSQRPTAGAVGGTPRVKGGVNKGGGEAEPHATACSRFGCKQGVGMGHRAQPTWDGQKGAHAHPQGGGARGDAQKVLILLTPRRGRAKPGRVAPVTGGAGGARGNSGGTKIGRVCCSGRRVLQRRPERFRPWPS